MMRAVILAGGKGTRLRPYTTTLPKPLVPIGDELPIVEVLIRQLARAGVSHITMAVSHLAKLIMGFFGEGQRWGVRIDYSIEDAPLGTMGPLTLIDDLPDDFLVFNGDTLCDLDFAAFHARHVASGDDATVAVSRRAVTVDFGVLELDGAGRVSGFSEKPTYAFDAAIGVYGLKRALVERFPRGRAYGFDELMRDALARGDRVGVVRHEGIWFDIGRPQDYDSANRDFESIRSRLGIDAS